MPARAQGTTEPTEKYFDWTAHPTSPASRSAATIENVLLQKVCRPEPSHDSRQPAVTTLRAEPAIDNALSL
jgi:hypothetical protein